MTTGRYVIHQLNAEGVCWREYTKWVHSPDGYDLMVERVQRGFTMAHTGLTGPTGEVVLGTAPKHEPAV